MAHPKVGNLAPAFTLLNQFNEKVSLKDLKGKKVLLYFYPKAMTPGCTTQACGLRDSAADLAKLNAVVFGISPDPVEKLLRFREKQSLNFDLLSDPEHKTAEKYGVWALKKFMGREFMGIVRTSFLINEEGRLVKVLDKFKTTDHHQVVLESLTF